MICRKYLCFLSYLLTFLSHWSGSAASPHRRLPVEGTCVRRGVEVLARESKLLILGGRCGQGFLGRPVLGDGTLTPLLHYELVLGAIRELCILGVILVTQVLAHVERLKFFVSCALTSVDQISDALLLLIIDLIAAVERNEFLNG